MKRRNCPLREPLPHPSVVRAMRKGRGRSAMVRTLYGYGLGISEIVEATKCPKNQVVQALRRVP